MKVIDLRNKYGVTPQYASEKIILDKYSDVEIDTYALFVAPMQTLSAVYVFKGARKWFAFIDGRRIYSIQRAIKLIENAKMLRKEPSEEVKRHAFAEEV